MKTISLWQHWASLVANGLKTIETRHWATSFRGPLAIHATARSVPAYFHRDINGDLPPEIDDLRMGSCWAWVEHPDDPFHGGAYKWVGPLGAIVATCRLVACVPITAPGPITTERAEEIRRSGTICAGSEALNQQNGLAYYRPGIEPGELSVDVSDQRPFGDFTPGRFGWILEEIEPLDPPVPAKGRQGFWEWEPVHA